jgi:hypothetical protein
LPPLEGVARLARLTHDRVGPNLLSLDRGDGVPVSDPVEDERTIDGDRARGIDDGGIAGGAKYPDELIRRSQKEKCRVSSDSDADTNECDTPMTGTSNVDVSRLATRPARLKRFDTAVRRIVSNERVRRRRRRANPGRRRQLSSLY